MKKYLIIIIFMALSLQAANNIVIPITTYKNGIPTTVDSLVLNLRFYSNATPTVMTDTTLTVFPTSFRWDTVITWDVGTDAQLLNNHELWFGNDVVYIDDLRKIRLDSVDFTDNVSFGIGTGSGPNTVFIYTVDSSAIPDDTLTGIDVFVNNLTGTPEASGKTNSLGYTTVNLTFDTWQLLAGTNITNYSFDGIQFTNTNNPDTFTIFGYKNVITDPIDPSKGLIFGFVKNVLGIADSGVIITLALEVASNVTSTSPGGYTVGDGIAFDTTDALGYFQFEVPISSTYSDTLKSLYNVLGELNKIPRFVVPNINVPDTGNVDITDEINNQ